MAKKKRNHIFKEYTSSIILGLNDAIVEMTGAIAGLTLALQNTRIIAVIGLITGIAAALSMAASEYLSVESEKKNSKNPLKASIETGLAYLIAVLVLISPYLIFKNIYLSLISTVTSAILMIFIYTYHLHVKHKMPFKKRFFEMTFLSLGIATVTFF